MQKAGSTSVLGKPSAAITSQYQKMLEYATTDTWSALYSQLCFNCVQITKQEREDMVNVSWTIAKLLTPLTIPWTLIPCRPFAEFKMSREKKSKTKWWQFENFETGCYCYQRLVSIGFCITIQVNGNARLASRRPIACQKLVNCRSNASVNEFSMISEVSQTNVKLILSIQSMLTRALTLLP